MNLRTRSLAKIFGPLLLTTALVLPVELLAAPSAAFAAVKVEKGDKKNEKNKQNRGQAKAQQQQREQAKQNRGQQQRQVQQQRQTRQIQAQQQREAKRIEQQQRNQVKLQAQQQRQAQVQRQQIQRQQVLRQQQLQRQAEVQRQAELRRQTELRRQAQLRRDNRIYYPRDRQVYNNHTRSYRNGDRFRYNGAYYGPNDRFHIDGFIFDEGSGCSLFRDHGTGETFALVGNIGDLQQGDHVRVQGRVVDGGVCDWRGTGFEVIQVKTLWSNNRHDHAEYDYQRDRISFEDFLDRYGY